MRKIIVILVAFLLLLGWAAEIWAAGPVGKGDRPSEQDRPGGPIDAGPIDSGPIGHPPVSEYVPSGDVILMVDAVSIVELVDDTSKLLRAE